MRGAYLGRKYADQDPDVCQNDYGAPDNRKSYDELEMIATLKNDWEQGIIHEIIWAETEQKIKDEQFNREYKDIIDTL